MNKKSMLARAVASGMLVANLAPIVLPSAHLVAGAISPSSYTQTAFDADMVEYKKKLAEYEKAKTKYEADLEKYQSDVDALKSRQDIVYQDTDVLIYGSEQPSKAGSMGYYGFTTVVKPESSKKWVDSSIGWTDKTEFLAQGQSPKAILGKDLDTRRRGQNSYFVDKLQEGDKYLLTNVGSVRGEPIDLLMEFQEIRRKKSEDETRRYNAQKLEAVLSGDERDNGTNSRGPEDLRIGISESGDGNDIEMFIRNISRSTVKITYLDKKGNPIDLINGMVITDVDFNQSSRVIHSGNSYYRLVPNGSQITEISEGLLRGSAQTLGAQSIPLGTYATFGSGEGILYTHTATTDDSGYPEDSDEYLYTLFGSATKMARLVPPVPPVKPEMPIGPTSVTKSVSRDGNTFSPSSTPADALDVGTQKDTWTWKLDFTLSNNTQYSSIVLEDSLENVQEVKDSDVHVFDEFGKDVTEQGSVTKTSEGDKTIVRWTPNADRLGIINAESTRNNPEKLQRYSMTIRATAANADGAALRRYMNADKMIVIPNVAKITVTGRSGNNPQNTMTEVSNTSHVKFKGENTVTNPEKKVTDLNERDVNSNHLGLVDRNQTYKISFDTGDGAIFGKLKIADSLPKGFTAKSDSIRITNTAGKDITSQFNVSLNGQELVATLKPEHATSTDLVSTKVTLAVSGTSVRWLGDTIKNTATVEDSEKTLKTNETVTVIPKDGTATKEASLEETEGFTKSEQAPTVVPSIYDEYTWRNTFELPTRTNYTKVEVRDVFESIQAIDQGKIRVMDEAGADVTGLGTISVTKINDNQSEIKWVGGADYLSKLNAAHGKGKDTTPKLVLSITTNVSEAQTSQLNRYMTGDKTVVIPNVSSIMLRDDSGITTDYKMDTNVSKVSVPSVVDNEDEGKPAKTVTDNDERDVAENRLGLTQTQQTYSITATTAAGHKLEKLVFTDQLPAQFKTDLSKVVITNAAGEVVTDLFDLSLTPENAFSAAVKEEAKADKRLIATEVTLKITGDLPKGLGTTVTNTARVEDQRGGYDTGTVTTYVPSTPESVKSVSVDGGSSFVEAGELAKRSDEYIWKVDHKLANLTEYSEIVLSDELDGIQEVDRTKIKVFDYQGADITDQGKLDVKESGGKKVVTWTAGNEVISSINTKFGAKSKDTPSLSMTISTNVREARNVQEAALYNAETGKVEIPNVAGLKITPKNDSTVEIKSNTPKVSLPTPGQSSAKKFVAKDGDNPQWSDKLQLANFDEVYQYRTEFKLADNFNFDEGTLTLTDIYEGIQSYDKVLVTDASGADISAKFDITSKSRPEDPFKVRITATPKRANDFDDKGEVINLVIKGAKLTGATGHQLTNYLSTKDSEGGFHSGVTVPNVSTITSTSTVPGQSQDVTSNKTYVNFDLEGRIEKSAEDELSQVVNPKDATSETPLADLVASAQKLITEPGKAKKAALEKLQAALTNSEITTAQLLTLLIEASK